jgi:photosystem II stability/assembly factor-like uncharacterized protein
MSRFAVVALAWCTLFAATSSATSRVAAHSQPPLVRSIQWQPNDATHMLAVAEGSGLFASNDAGRHWSLICSQSYGVDPYAVELPSAVLLDAGTIAIAAGNQGLRISDDGGCNFSRHAAFAAETVSDVVGVGSDALYVLSWSLDEAGGVVSRIRRSTDHTRTFSASEFASDYTPRQLLVAASDPNTLYVLAYRRDPAGWTIASTRDAGASFRTIKPPLADMPSVWLKAAAIDPRHADVFYVISSVDDPTSVEVGQVLWMTRDAGDTWLRLLASPSTIINPVYSPDGRELVFGSLQTGVYRVEVDALGADLSQTTPLSMRPISALAWSEQGLYAGANNYVLGPLERFSIGIEQDDAGTFAPLLSLCDLVPLECSSGTTASQCSDTPHAYVELQNSVLCRPEADDTQPPVREPEPSLDAGTAQPRAAAKHASSCVALGPVAPAHGSVWILCVAMLWVMRRFQRRVAARCRS